VVLDCYASTQLRMLNFQFSTDEEDSCNTPRLPAFESAEPVSSCHRKRAISAEKDAVLQPVDSKKREKPTTGPVSIGCSYLTFSRS